MIPPNPVTISINPSAINITSTSTPTNITVTNTGNEIAYGITAILNNSPDITLINNTCLEGIAPSKSCTLSFLLLSGATPIDTPVNFLIMGNNTIGVPASYLIPTPVLNGIVPNQIPKTAYNFQATLSGLNINIGNPKVIFTFTNTSTSSTYTKIGVILNNLSVAPDNLVVVVPGVEKDFDSSSMTVQVQVQTDYGKSAEDTPVSYYPPTIGDEIEGGVIAIIAGDVVQSNSWTAPYTLIINKTESDGQWSPANQAHIVTNATSAADGRVNTINIVNKFTGQYYYSKDSYIAGLCTSLKLPDTGIGSCQTGEPCYSSWFSGALNEFLAVYQSYSANKLGNANLYPAPYWTSSTSSSPDYRPYYIGFSNGAIQSTTTGYEVEGYRCLRRA